MSAGSQVCGIPGDAADHAADLVVLVDGVADLDGLGRRHELVVQVLVGALVVLVGGVAGERQEHDGVVDLVEGQPVVHEALELAEARRGIAHEVVDGLAVLPAAAVLLEVERRVKVPDGHERLDAVLVHLLEHVLVEGHALGVGLFSRPVGNRRLQLMDMRNCLKPISPKRAMSSL